MPGKGILSILDESRCVSINVLPALLCILINGKGLGAEKCMRKSMFISCIIGMALLFAVQLCIGLSFGYEELQSLYTPLYRIDMILIKEGYYLRFDKLILFLCLVGGLIAAAFYLYSGALLAMELSGASDIRPGIVTGAALLSGIICLQFSSVNKQFTEILCFVGEYGFFVILGISVLIGAASQIKTKSLKKVGEKI